MTKAQITVQAGGVELSAIHSRPAGQPRALIVALHGGTYDARYFDRPGGSSFVDLATSLGYDVLAIDRPGYGAARGVDPQHSTFAGQRKLLASGIETVWNTEAEDTPGVILVGHSIGGAIALCAASEPLGVPLLGVEASGIGIVWRPGVRELWESLIGDAAEVMVPPEARNELMYGPPGSYDPEVQASLASEGQPLPMPELRDVVDWGEHLTAVAPKITVPVKLTIPEFDKIWSSNQDALDGLERRFTSAPVVEVRRQRGVGHSIDSHYAARAYHFQVLSFAEECVLRARVGHLAAAPVS